MNPFYFGTSERPLFGVHTPAKGSSPRGSIVLCYPLGAEYMRAHRAFRQLTQLLSRAGFDVLRFDYSNTGDSAGSSEDASLERWLEDVGTAIDEMKEMTEVEGVVLIGLRLGAAVAAMAGAARNDVDRLVLWDPIVRGAPYVGALTEAAGHPAGVRNNGHAPDMIGVAGFPLSRGLLTELSDVNLLETVSGLPPTDLVVSEEEDAYGELHGALRALQPSAALVVRPSPNQWMEGDAFGSALIPSAIIEGIVQQIERAQ